MVRSSGGARPEILALLRAHGLSAAVAARVAQVGATLHQRSAQAGVEVGTTLDLATGRPIGPTLTGELDRVDFASQFAAFRPGRRYLQIHTHPGSSSFSAPDVGMLLEHSALQTLVVVGADEHWHLLSKRPGHRMADPDDAHARWWELFDNLASQDDPLVAQGHLTQQAALVREVHETMIRLAPEFGLRYDDLEYYA